MLGIWSTLIIMEVIPFLVLAVGVDNMFILALLDARQPASASPAERAAATLAAAGPSILLASTCEAVAFAVAASASMPAVRNFALCATIAVVLDFVLQARVRWSTRLVVNCWHSSYRNPNRPVTPSPSTPNLQVTAFVALLTMDAARMRRGAADCCPCFLTPPSPPAPHAPSLQFEVTDSEPHSPASEREWGADAERTEAARTWLQRYMARTHAPFLARPAVKVAVLASCLAAVLASLSLVQRVGIGLDLSVALPRDSYLQRYYRCGQALGSGVSRRCERSCATLRHLGSAPP